MPKGDTGRKIRTIETSKWQLAMRMPTERLATESFSFINVLLTGKWSKLALAIRQNRQPLYAAVVRDIQSIAVMNKASFHYIFKMISFIRYFHSLFAN